MFANNTANIRGGGLYSKKQIVTTGRILSGEDTSTTIDQTTITENYGALAGGLNYEG